MGPDPRTLGHRDDQINDLVETFRRHAYEPLKETGNARPGQGAAIEQVETEAAKTGAEGSKA